MASRRRRSAQFRKALGERLRARRIELSRSQEGIALESEVTQGSISNYEAGRSDISVVVLLSICQALQVDLLEILPTKDSMRPRVGWSYQSSAALDDRRWGQLDLCRPPPAEGA